MTRFVVCVHMEAPNADAAESVVNDALDMLVEAESEDPGFDFDFTILNTESFGGLAFDVLTNRRP